MRTIPVRNTIPTTIRIAAIAASLRAGSWNGRLVAAAAGVALPGLELFVVPDLAAIPLFDEDLEAADPAGPRGVRALRRAVADADGVLISTPEYNQSIPGVTKNLVDWLSRPEGAGVLDGKPVAITGATTGPWGTRYAQKELRHALTAIGALVMPQPMLFVPRAATMFDEAGALVDPYLQRQLADFVQSFQAWIHLVGSPTVVAAAG